MERVTVTELVLEEVTVTKLALDEVVVGVVRGGGGDGKPSHETEV